MKFIKKIIVKIFHSLGFDIVRIPKYYDNLFSGLINIPIRTIFDVGANRGQFAKRALKAFPNAHIYCFEPGKKAFVDLKKWADSQGGKVSVFNIALGDSEADLNFYEHPENDEGSSFLRSINQIGEIPVLIHQTTLDAFVKSESISLEPEILVKIDTQGYDDRVIMGAKEVLSKSKACITEIIFDREYYGQGNFKKIFYLLDTLGFEFVGLQNQHFGINGEIQWADAIFRKK
jgi:FkbM family methyltransferase